MSCRANCPGFTLLEVLVALAVLALALGAAVAASSRYIDNAAYLRDKTLAHWVALNLITEQQLQTESPAPGTLSGTTAMAGRDWVWRARISETPDGNVRSIDVEVSDSQDQAAVLASRAGFLQVSGPGQSPP